MCTWLHGAQSMHFKLKDILDRKWAQYYIIRQTYYMKKITHLTMLHFPNNVIRYYTINKDVLPISVRIFYYMIGHNIGFYLLFNQVRCKYYDIFRKL